ncbi:hypothetical protein HNP11_004241 [Tsukamurella ocularis]|nr:hypothetical protein [Tsukamurella ocularis]
MNHVDVTQFGNIPDGGGWQFVGKQQGDANRAATVRRDCDGAARRVTAFVHTVTDDHSRVAYAETHTDEKAATAIGVLRRATAWFAARDVVVERVLSRQRIRLPFARLAPGLHRSRDHA